MFGIGARFGTLAIAAAILFISHRLHKSSKRGAKNIAVIGAFVAGLAFLVTFVGGWMRGADWLGGFSVAGLIVCAGIVLIDWLIDKKPDKPAFWAAFALALFIVIGVANLPKAGQQIGQGGKQVTEQLSKVGK